MIEPTSLVLSIPSRWGGARAVRASVAENLPGLDPEVLDATVMVASELVENAIKYGKAQGQNVATFELTRTAEHIEMKVTSVPADPAMAQLLMTQLEVLRASTDPYALFLERLGALMSTVRNKGPCRLGLLRISGEGRFALSATLGDDVLQVRAIRELAR